MNSVLVGILLAAIALIVLVGSSLRRRSQRELRSRIFEIVAAAVRRAVPISPAIRRMAQSESGLAKQSLEEFAERLDAGESVGTALASSLPAGTIPRDVLAAIRSTEGTPAHRRTLIALAGSEDRVQSAQDKLSMALAYPALLAVSLVGVQASTGSLFDAFRNAGPGVQVGLSSIAVHLVALGLWTMLGFAIVGNLSSVRSRANRLMAMIAARLPFIGPIYTTAASARVLRAASALAAGGMPFGEMLRRASRATGMIRLRREVAAAADHADTGASSDDVWHRTGLPDYAVALAELAVGSDPHEIGRRLQVAAEACDRRVDRSVHRALGLLQPAVIVVIGALIASQFAMVFDRLQNFHGGGHAW
ncbi:MAG: type II secretion system F family protein [Planctomycetota bacterium]